MGASSQTGFEAFYQDVAPIVFSNVSNATNADHVGAITFAQFDPSIVTGNNGQTNIASGFEQTAAWQINFLSSAAMKDQVGDIWLNKTQIANPALGTGDNTQFSIVLHEIGHALGLEHSSASTDGDELSPHLGGEEDSVKYTIMIPGDDHGSAAFNHSDMYYDSDDSPYKYTTSLGLYDVAALQTIYGRDYTTRTIDTTYDINHGLTSQAFTYTIWDGGGIDNIDASGYTTPVEIDLRQGHFSSIGLDGNPDGGRVVFDDESLNSIGDPFYDAGNVAIAFYAVIENAIGTNANDILIGNAWSNVLYGSGGDDTVYGDGLTYDSDRGFGTKSGETDKNSPSPAYAQDLSGDDVLIGGKDNDTLFGGRGSDILEGGFNTAQLNTANPHWNDAHQFDGIQDVAVADDGMDTANYSQLTAAPSITVHITDAANHAGTADKTYTLTELNGRVEHATDQFFSIEKFIGTSGTDTVDLRNHASGTYTIDDRTHITIDGQQFEFQGFEKISLNDPDDNLLANGIYGWSIDGGGGTNTLNLANAASAPASDPSDPDGLNGITPAAGGGSTSTFPGLTVDLVAGTVTDGTNTDHIANFQNVTGSGGDDTIYAKELIASHIEGGLGNDTLDFSKEFQPTFDWIQNTNEILFDMASGTATDIGHGTVSFTGIEHIVLGTGTINQVDAALGSSIVFSDGESLRAYNINDIFNYSNLGGVHFEVQLNGDVLVHKADGTIDTILHSDEIQHVFVTTPRDDTYIYVSAKAWSAVPVAA